MTDQYVFRCGPDIKPCLAFTISSLKRLVFPGTPPKRTLNEEALVHVEKLLEEAVNNGTLEEAMSTPLQVRSPSRSCPSHGLVLLRTPCDSVDTLERDLRTHLDDCLASGTLSLDQASKLRTLFYTYYKARLAQLDAEQTDEIFEKIMVMVRTSFQEARESYTRKKMLEKATRAQSDSDYRLPRSPSLMTTISENEVFNFTPSLRNAKASNTSLDKENLINIGFEHYLQVKERRTDYEANKLSHYSK
jgi:hypothetical protein